MHYTDRIRVKFQLEQACVLKENLIGVFYDGRNSQYRLFRW